MAQAKASPKACYNQIETYFLNIGFVKCFREHTLFVNVEEK